MKTSVARKANSAATAAPAPRPLLPTEAFTLKRGELDMKLIINRVHRHLRFTDFRVGDYQTKRDILDTIARKEKLRKVFTLVERYDSQTWQEWAFVKEGICPGFFRTSDAYVMSRLYDEDGRPTASPSMEAPIQSEPNVPPAADALTAPSGVELQLVADERSRSDWAAQKAKKNFVALPFGQLKLPDLLLYAKAQQSEGWISAEIDPSYGHAAVDFASNQPGEDASSLSSYAAQSLVQELVQRSVNNAFGLCAADDEWTNDIYKKLGFNVTARLAFHLRTPTGFKHAVLWHRPLRERGPSRRPAAPQRRRAAAAW